MVPETTNETVSQNGCNNGIELHIEYLTSVNYALIHNKIALCNSVELTNTTETEFHEVMLECSGEFFQTTQAPAIDVVKAGQKLRLQPLELRPDALKVASVTEKITSSFKVKVIIDALQTDTKSVICECVFPIDIMPYDQWLGTKILPQCLASFVLPNHPAINEVVVKAASILKDLTHSSAFNEYQSGNPNEVRKQVAAIYGALHAENIVYRALPASFETIGQRITLPDQVLATKLGNCIELSLLFASVLESVGINSGIILQQGHAYLAVWLVDDCCQYSVCDDPSFIEKKCSEGIGEMIVIECTEVTSENTSFEEAQRIAKDKLANLKKFQCYIDIRRCRLERILPLPQRIFNDGKWEIKITDGVIHDECVLDVKEHSRYDLSKIIENKRKLDKMDIWERKLLDFSLRNSMLNLYLRQKAIQFITFNIDEIEDRLHDGAEYLIMPKPDVDLTILSTEEQLIRSKQHTEIYELASNDIKHRTLHTYHTELETKHTLKNIYRSSRNAIEETGANALYLAIGTLRWYETELSEKPRYAPILMLPVEMVYKKGNYYIRTRDEEIVLNITLIEFLRQNFDIKIPGLDPLPTDEHGVDVSLIFTLIREALKNKKRWDVEEEAILGIFSFSKFLMWNDIHNHRKELLSNGIVQSLVEQRLVCQEESVSTDLKECDKNLSPNALSLPVAADSSQMAAIIAGGKGRSFILYGPPGTGKSQTITNLIANALFQGKRVLFVAEKMAALSVVMKRLENIGLAPFCLEMHSNKITKRHVLEQLKKALDVTHIVKPEEYERTAEQLYAHRCKLIEYMEALHDVKGTDALSVYDCIVRYESLTAPTLSFDTTDEQLRKHFCLSNLEGMGYLLHERYLSVTNLIGQPSKHPLLGLNITDGDLADLHGMTERMKEVKTMIESGINNSEKLAKAPNLKSEILRDSNESVFAADPEALYHEWKAIRTKWFIPRFFGKKKYLEKLRGYNPLIIEQDIDGYLNKLLEYKSLHNEITKIQEAISKFFDYRFESDKLPSAKVMSAFAERISTWLQDTDKARDWYQWCAYKQEISEAGLGEVARFVETQEIQPDILRDAFFKTMFRQLANEKIAQSPILRTFEGSIFDETVTRYRKLTDEFQQISQKELYARLASQIPRVTDNTNSASEIGKLNRNISNGGRGLSLRDLLDQIPTLLPRLCPCMLMSPMSVAQFLTLTQEKFDLVIFDEASQMPTSEAVGAIARGKAVIVVGDPKQMPPTSFFCSTSVSEEEADIDDMESILEDCRTLEIPSLQLNWHYRSRHESLIAFSNNEYYDGSLITFPSVDDKTSKVKYHFVEGVYDKGGQRSNKIEAEAIVNEIVKRLTAPDHAQRSIGVIAFSVVQQNLIEDLLIERFESDTTLREAADEIYEPIFIKNLENVQGDERDIILFSIGYGPDKDGKVSMNFGPLNNAGGERRLNVAVSRARMEMMVFTGLKSSQIDLRRSQARGVEGLKHFLEYAEQQILVQPNNASTKTSDSVIAEQIAAALRERGYLTQTKVGRSSFKIDVAVGAPEDNGIFTLGLLLDGQSYHDTQTTRDREIVQPSVLGGLNWKIMRIWSVDWLNNPERLISRIEKQMKEKPTQTEVATKPTFDISNEIVEEAKSEMTAYNSFSGDPNALTDKQLILEITHAEQPITPMHLCHRFCALRDMTRVTPSTQTMIAEIAKKDLYTQSFGTNLVVWSDPASAESFTGYRQSNGRDITEIPIVEINNAMMETITEHVSIDADALKLAVAKKLGFARRGTKVEQAMNDAVGYLLASHKIADNGGMLHIN